MLSNLLRLLTGGFIMGWGPCLAITGPLLLPYIGGTKTNWQGGLRIAFLFSLGRLLALAILGGLATIAFSFINRFFPPQRSGWLYLIVAIFMLLLGILIILGKGFKVPGTKIIKKKVLDSSRGSMLFLGFLLGIAPCVPYVAILTYIACIAENTFLLGVLYAASFALGTAFAPLVLGALTGGFAGKMIKWTKLLKAFQIVCGVALILFSLQLIYYTLHVIS